MTNNFCKIQDGYIIFKRIMKVCGVIGGGISGLATCYYLNKLGKGLIEKIILLESNAKCGGWVDSVVDENGVLFEKGPRSIRSRGISALNTIELIDELGLKNEVLPISKNHLSTKNRFIYVKGHLHKLPNNLKAIITTTPPFTKPFLYSIMKEAFTPKLSEKQDWSVDEFFRKRFGSEIADYMVDPLCRGIYAGSSKHLSMASSFSPIHDLEARFSSVVKGMVFNKKENEEMGELAKRFKKEGWVIWSLRQGLQQLPRSILQHLATNENVHVQTNTACLDLIFKDNKVEVVTDSKEPYQFDHVFSALPSFELSQIANKNHPFLSELLRKIEFVDVGVVNLVYAGDVRPPNVGFGHLVPSHEDPAVLGVIYEGCTFHQHNGPHSKNRFTVMLGGHWFKDVFGGEGGANVMNKLEEMSIKTMHQHLGIKANPEKVIVNLLQKCIPQYSIGHKNLVSQISSYLSSNNLAISLVGSSYKGVSVNDCIYNSRLAVQEYLQHS